MTKKAKRTSAHHKKAAAKDDAQPRTVAAQDLFLTHYVAVGNVSGACRMSGGIGRRTVYNWLETDAAFKARYAEAQTDAIDALEQEARRRALVGIDKPIYHQGKRVDTVKEYSDVLLIFLLKGHKPEKYRERFEHTGRGGGPIQVRKTVTFGGRYKPKP